MKKSGLKNLAKKIFDTFVQWREINTFNRTLGKVNIDDIKVFDQISIETINRCNGKCSFCPVNVKQPQRKYALMEVDLFNKIIEELADLNYRGTVCFSLNNEPFLDERICDFITKARELLPEARFIMWTNGSLINSDHLCVLVPIMDKIYIDQYSEKGGVREGLKNTLKEADLINEKDYKIYNELDFSGGETISIFIRNSNEILSSRGGNAPNKKIKRISARKCTRFFVELPIRPDGKVSLCCSDALGQFTLGDISKDSLLDVWRGEPYTEVRRKMIRYGRKGIPLCKYCDFES